MSTIQDVLLEKVLPTVLSGAAGILGTAWKYARTIGDKVNKIETDLAAVTVLLDKVKASFEDYSTNTDGTLASLRAQATSARAEAKNDILKLLGDLQRQGVQLTQRLDKHRGELQSLDAKIKDGEGDLQRVEKRVNEFIQEQQSQWQEIHRTLGQIEGNLQRRAR